MIATRRIMTTKCGETFDSAVFPRLVPNAVTPACRLTWPQRPHTSTLIAPINLEHEGTE